MDKIIFRGKDKTTDEWVYGYYFAKCGVNEDGTKGAENHFIVQNDKVVKVDGNTVAMGVGLEDCNGTALFVGDIVGGYEIRIELEDKQLKHYIAPIRYKVVFEEGTTVLLNLTDDISFPADTLGYFMLDNTEDIMENGKDGDWDIGEGVVPCNMTDYPCVSYHDMYKYELITE